jgi:hypothetical protein
MDGVEEAGLPRIAAGVFGTGGTGNECGPWAEQATDLRESLRFTRQQERKW